ncbi:MAG: signal peptidase II [Eubacteriales bacterium]
MQFLIWILTALGVVAADQFTKWLAVTYLKPLGSVGFIPHIMDLTYLENKGAAFGMFSDARWVHMSVSTVAVIAIIIYMCRTKQRSRLLAVSAGMIIGGGIGNLIDRFFVGYVVDFFEPIFVNFAVFNVADSFVCVGAALLFIYVLMYDRKNGSKSKTPTNNSVSGDNSNGDGNG